ncbi:MAG: PQQ-binding-like beta-propeller repeat protein [Ignavibacteria bacterium]|nr:PQQ-binding-like beta-propeller repeat protein [Ignavibacteria bacterium]
MSRNCLSAADAVLFVSTLKGECYGIDVTSGRSIGRLEMGSRASYSTPLILGNSVVLVSTGNIDGRIFKTSLQTGILKWSRFVGFVGSSPVLYDKDVFVCSTNGKVYRLSSQTGSIIWTSRAEKTGRSSAQFYTSPTISGENSMQVQSTGQCTASMQRTEKVNGNLKQADRYLRTQLQILRGFILGLMI